MVTRPDSNAPTANYDITLEDDHGKSVAGTQLNNRHTANVEAVWPYRASAGTNRHMTVTLADLPRLKIDNAGAGNQGMIGIYAMRVREAG